MIWVDSVKRNGLRLQTLLDVKGERLLAVLLAEVVKSIKCRGANNFGTRGFVKNNDFLMTDFIFSEYIYINYRLDFW